MAETTILRQEVDSDKVSKLVRWMEGVDNRESEIIETLQDECVKTESAFLEQSPQGTFLVTYIEADDLQQAQETFEQSTHDIDAEYKQIVQECLTDGQPVGSFEPLYHATDPDR